MSQSKNESDGFITFLVILVMILMSLNFHGVNNRFDSLNKRLDNIELSAGGVGSTNRNGEPNMFVINKMTDGQIAYTVSWAFKMDARGNKYVAGIYDATKSPGGTLSVCIKREGKTFRLCGGATPEWTDEPADWGWIPIVS